MTIFETLRITHRLVAQRPIVFIMAVLSIGTGTAVLTLLLTVLLNIHGEHQGLETSFSIREVTMSSAGLSERQFHLADQLVEAIEVGRLEEPSSELTESDLSYFWNACPAIEFAYIAQPMYLQLPRPANDKTKSNGLFLLGVSQIYFQAANLRLISGTWPTQRDFQVGSSVIMLTEQYARYLHSQLLGKISDARLPLPIPEKLFQHAKDKSTFKNLIGESIVSFNGFSFKIIGIFATPNFQADFSKTGFDSGAVGIVPYATKNPNLSSTSLELKFLTRSNQREFAINQLQAASARKFGDSILISPSHNQFIQRLNTLKQNLMLIALFSAISFLIPMLCITDLFVARVTQRKRFIAISRAIGANSASVFKQFFIEFSALQIMGISLGLIVSMVLFFVINDRFRFEELREVQKYLLFQPLNFLFTSLTCFAAGLLFALYPAWISTKIPISEVLRDVI